MTRHDKRGLVVAVINSNIGPKATFTGMRHVDESRAKALFNALRVVAGVFIESQISSPVSVWVQVTPGQWEPA